MATEGQYYDCILRHLKEAKLDLTTDLMKKACQENYRSSSISLRDRHTYNECLLEKLAGVENTKAALEIKDACSRKHL